MFLGVRTVVCPAPDLAASKAWFTGLLGIAPYFDEPCYVGFDVGGYELALDPSGDPATGPVKYSGGEDVDTALLSLVEAAATARGDVQEVGGGIRVATVLEPGGSVFGVIENPHFALPESPPESPPERPPGPTPEPPPGLREPGR